MSCLLLANVIQPLLLICLLVPLCGQVRGGARLLVPGVVRAPGPARAQAATALQQILRHLVSTPLLTVCFFRMLPLSDFDHVHCLFSFYLYSNLDTLPHRALGFLLLRMVIKDFPSFDDQRRNWTRFNAMLQLELDALKVKASKLPAGLQVDLLCELIQASLQEKPEDRCAQNTNNSTATAVATAQSASRSFSSLVTAGFISALPALCITDSHQQCAFTHVVSRFNQEHSCIARAFLFNVIVFLMLRVQGAGGRVAVPPAGHGA